MKVDIFDHLSQLFYILSDFPCVPPPTPPLSPFLSLSPSLSLSLLSLSLSLYIYIYIYIYFSFFYAFVFLSYRTLHSFPYPLSVSVPQVHSLLWSLYITFFSPPKQTAPNFYHFFFLFFLIKTVSLLDVIVSQFFHSMQERRASRNIFHDTCVCFVSRLLKENQWRNGTENRHRLELALNRK